MWRMTPNETVVVNDDGTERQFATVIQARWFVASGEELSAAEAARSMAMADQFLEEINGVKRGARKMFDAQQLEIFSTVNLMKLRGHITLNVDGTVIVNKTDAQLTAMGLDRTETELGLAKLILTVSSVSQEDSAAIAAFMN